MFTQSLSRAAAATLSILLSTASFVGAQDQEPALKITRHAPEQRQYNRTTPVAQMSRDATLNRVHPADVPALQQKSRVRPQSGQARISTFGLTRASASSPALLSFGTGGGDTNEIEPNDLVAQGVSLPVNIFGKISLNHDADFFAFEALAGQQITIEPFAARLNVSQLIADIALFDSSGRLLASDAGDESHDPLIRYVSASDQVLVVGITDLDDLGGPFFDYVLNITRGQDVDEQEPNDQTAQQVSDVPATIFGRIGNRNDVDFYSFTANAGETLIVDVDAEVLGSQLDAEINLTDPATGIEFFYDDQHDGDDPRFNIVLPYTGRYVIGIGTFGSSSSGFYRLNASLVSSAGAPTVSKVARLAKKLLEVSGSGFTAGSVVEVNGLARKTTFIDSRTLQAKVKAKVGNVVTVASPPDDRRSNPLLVQ